MTSHIASNIKFLRKKAGISQDELANKLNIKRTSLSGYEIGNTEPNIDLLLKLSREFHISIDTLISQNLEMMNDIELEEVLTTTTVELSGKKLRVLATTVDSNNEENIELVPVAAKAGYTTGFADPDYIRVLPTFHLPFLSKNRKYRTFPISGDSMPPVEDGAWVTGEYLQNWNFISSGNPYIIVTKNDGIVFKIAYNQIAERGSLLLCSTNPEYEPYSIHVNEILEVWKFVHYISNELPQMNFSKDEVSSAIIQMQRDMALLKSKIS
jgi:transcriptional regulator with XRE-family HTH domain